MTHWWEYPLAALVFLGLLLTAPVWIVLLAMFVRAMNHGSPRAERILVAIAERARDRGPHADLILYDEWTGQ